MDISHSCETSKQISSGLPNEVGNLGKYTVNNQNAFLSVLTDGFKCLFLILMRCVVSDILQYISAM